MRIRSVARRDLERVPKRMSQIEQPAQITLALVFGYDLYFDFCGTRNRIVCLFARPVVQVCAMRFNELPELTARKQGGLHDFRRT